METSHFYSIWKTSRPKNTRISFLHKTFQKTLKNTRIRILYPKIRQAYLSLCHGNTTPWGAILTTVFKYRSFAFCMTKRLSPQVEVKSRKTKENGISHIRETALIHDTKEIINIVTNLHTGYLTKIAKKRGTQISSYAHIYVAFSVI